MTNDVDIKIGRYKITRIETITGKKLPVIDGLEIRKYQGKHGENSNSFITLGYIHANGVLESFQDNLIDEVDTSKIDIKDFNSLIQIGQEIIQLFNNISKYFDEK